MVKKSATPKHRKYEMSVAGQMFRHLGLQMYSGAAPAIAELISNAYDAMAKNVWIDIPLGRALDKGDIITVRDDGHGMTFDEANSFYLHVGRNRRATGSDLTKPYNGLAPRKIQGRKGIGKLAGFGIADRIEVKTKKKREYSHFALDFKKITKSDKFADVSGYRPETLSDDAKLSGDKAGTLISLSGLKISRSINEEQFRTALARRLLVLDSQFSVHVNGRKITRSHIPFQFRYPKSDWNTEKLENGKKIQWWAGFSKKPIGNEEQRGIVVYARGKLAQTPWFFDLSGGTWGQHGLQYLTGEVRADFLDDAEDLIATDRGSVRWEDPTAEPLKEWGQEKIRELLETWADSRREEKSKSPRIAELLKESESLPDRERKIFKRVVDKIISIPQLDEDREGKDIADELVEFAYNALTNRSFLDAIKSLNAASADSLSKFNTVISEWDIIEAVNTAHLVRGRVEIIRTFKKLIADRAPEKPDMQDQLKNHPWLIDPKWTVLAHEKSLDRVISEHFNLVPEKSAGGKLRLDFFCLGDRSRSSYVIEAKRPGDRVGNKEIQQLQRYVHFLRRKNKETTDTSYARSEIKGYLIADKIREDDRELLESVQKAGDVEWRTWNNLLSTTEALHEDFLEIVTERAPSNDPRMQTLSRLEKRKRTSGKRKKRRKKKRKPKAK